MAAYGANYGGEAGDEVGSQFSAPHADLSGQPAAAASFGGYPYYGGLPYTAFGAAGAYPTAFPGAQFGAPQYAAAPAAFPGATAFGAAPVFEGAAAGPAYTQVAAVPYAVPTAVPVPVRRPGYNERYVAWKNRQKAFNRYKAATKAAIKNARNLPTNTYALAPATTLVQQNFAAPTYFGAAAAPTGFAAAAAAPAIAPTAFGFEQYGSVFPYGAAYGAPYGAPFGAPFAAYPAAAAPAASFAGEFTSYSEASQGVQQEQQPEEPEIRGTQV